MTESKSEWQHLREENSILLVHIGVRLYGTLGISAYFAGVNNVVANSLKDKTPGIKTHSMIFAHYYQFI